MPQIPFNLSSQQCPDHTLDMFNQAQPPLINDITTHKQAALLLTNIWMASNAAKQQLWQVQVEADKAAAKVTQQQQDKEEALRAAEV